MAERNEKGQFVKGYKGGPGRPKKTREERYLEITKSAVTFDMWKKIVTRAASDALRGDAQARKWLSDNIIGPPTQRQEITGADGSALIPILAESAIEKIYGDTD
jgi:hypothetical protein